MNGNRKILKCFATLGFICFAIKCAVAVVQGADLTNHPIFAKYPSTDELRRRVETFKRHSPEAFAAAREDFDLAIRSTLDLQAPQIPGEPTPHVVKEWPLSLPSPREHIERWIKNWKQTPDGEPVIAFLRAHMDELAMDYTPALQMVALDVILNGWSDWSRWTTDRLTEYKKRYPDVYRLVALQVIGYFIANQDYRDADGLLLRLLVDPTLSYDAREQIQGFATRGDPDILDFVVDCSLHVENKSVRDACALWTQRFSKTLSNEQRQVFWMRYLDSQDRSVRNVAVIEIGLSRLRSREESLATHPDQRIVARLMNIADTDPDEQIRAAALNGVKAYTDDSPPRGLIDYNKPQP